MTNPIPSFREVDVNKDGLVDSGEITGWVIGRQSLEDVQSLEQNLCLPEYIGVSNKNNKMNNYELNKEQRDRLHSLADNYCYPMVYYKLDDDADDIDYNGIVYPTTRYETMGLEGAHHIWSADFEDYMIDQQFNGKLDLNDVLHHFMFANKGYDFSAGHYAYDPQTGKPYDPNGYGAFNIEQWNMLFNCQP